MLNDHDPFPLQVTDLSQRQIELLVREGRRQRALAVRRALLLTIAGMKALFRGMIEKIYSAGNWLIRRTA